MKRLVLSALFFTALFAGSTRASADNWNYCPSNHGSGYVYFDPIYQQAYVYQDGTYLWHLGVPLYLGLDCDRDEESTRPSWECVEQEPYKHPDGRTTVSIQVSFEYYLMVSTRFSAEYGAEIVTDDYTCYH